MQQNRIRVLQIIGDARLGGVSSCVMNYFKHADLSRFAFDFVTYSPSPFDGQVRATDGDAKIYHISPFQKNFLKGVSDLEKILKNNEYQIVHSHLGTLSAFTLPAAENAGVPVRICHAHSAFNKNSEHYMVKSFLRPMAADSATHLMACSKHAAQNTFLKRASEAVILPDAIDVNRFCSSEEQYIASREKLGLHGKAVLFAGRFAKQKNIPFLLDAFADAAGEDMTLVLVGGGEGESELRSRAEKLGIAEKVLFIPPADPAEWYKASDVFCLPSRYEGLGMVAVEAQAAGLKCILSENVPKEADVGGDCVFLPLKKELWAAEMQKSCPHFYGGEQKVRDAGYDILREAHRLTDFYESALSGANQRK